MIVEEHFFVNWGRTLRTWLVAFSGGLGSGALMAFLSSYSSTAGWIITPSLSYLRAIPPIALFPVVLVAVGVGEGSIAFVAGSGACLYVYPLVLSGAMRTRSQYEDLSKLLKADRWRFVIYIMLPGTLVYTIVASRLAATYAFAVCVAGEMIIGGNYGVGAAILDYSERYQLEQAYAYVFTAGIIGLLIDIGFTAVVNTKLVQRALQPA